MIAVISDTHIPNRADKIPEEFIEIIKKAETTIHAGDFETPEVHRQIKQISNEFYAVMGNCDKFQLPQSQKLNRENLEIGVYHGTGITPRGHTPTLLDIAKNKLEVDILVNGHTHQQEVEKREEVLLLNPGTATGVGGGSSTKGNPKMATIKIQEQKEIRVTRVEETDSGLAKQKETYSLS